MTATPAEEKPCDHCGRFEAIEAGDRFLCADCLSDSASSCAGQADKGC
jgi:hypothetical protein